MYAVAGTRSLAPDQQEIPMGIGRLDGSRFNLIMSVRHQASAARLDQWHQSFQRASELLFDATDGQHQLGTVFVCNSSSGGRNADGWLLEEDGRSSAGGLGVLGTETIHMTLYGDERFKPFVLLHEMIHYLYGPADEYSGPGGDGAECIGAGPPNDACVMERGWWEGDRFGDDATGGALVVGAFNELCVASNHDPDSDTHQENISGESCWETMTDAFPGLTIPTTLPAGPAPAGAATIGWVELAAEERFVLVIDRSGSMAGSKLGEAKFGADWWAQQTLVEELLGVVSYASTVSSPADHPLEPITSQGDRDAASAAVAAISAGGNTAMGDAMRAALGEFLDRGQRAATQVVVLLTDGLTNTGEHPSAVLPDLVANGVRVYPIGIGADIDTALLESIAAATGGSLYRIDPTLSPSGQETAIRDAMIEISGISRDGGGVVTTQPERVEDQPLETEVLIEKGSELATFGVSWPDSKTMLFVSLEAPDGTVISSGSVPAGARELGRRDPWHGFQVERPEPGRWRMRVDREFGDVGTTYQRFVFSRNRSVEGGVHVPRHHQPGARIPVAFRLYHDAPVHDLTLVATVTLPNGKAVPLDLERGPGTDGCLSGSYEGWFASTKASGVHTVTVDVVADQARRADGGEKQQDGETAATERVPELVRRYSTQFLVGEERHPRFSIDPDRGEPGQSLEVHFKGRATSWSQRGTRVGFGDGVVVEGLDVLGPREMVARITLGKRALPGPRAVVVSTPRRQGTLSLDEGFTVEGRPTGRPGRRPLDGLRFDPAGRLLGALSSGELLGIDESAVETILRMRRSGSTVRVVTDEQGEVTGFDVD